MTPRGFDASVVHVRLHRMSETLAWLDDLGEVSKERLVSDDLLRPAVLWQLVQLVELAVAINGHLAASLLGRAPIEYRESFGLVARAGAIPAELAEDLQSRDVEPAARISNDPGVENDENGQPMWLCTGQRAPWPALWPEFRHYS